MARPFDLARDLPSLIRAAAGRLAPGGTLLFVCPVAALEVPPDVSPGLRAREITRETTPRDFERRPRQRVWVIETPARSRR
jgi:23S rRNA (guanine2445-N2)-methyltransferase / 23S rRNA (guanine2069-N7)-methyltransferase